MKKILILLMLVLIAPFMKAQAQPCGSDAMLKSMLEKNPEAKEVLKLFDLQLKEKLGSIQQQKSDPPNITIPVVFYIVYDPANPNSNILNNQVDSQLDALNSYFYNYGIKFCKATQAGGQAINSITRINNAALSNHDSVSEQQALINLIGNPNITAERFLRIWIVNTIDGPSSSIQAYSSLAPYIPPSFDGIVIKHSVFGDENNLNCGCVLLPEKNTGKTLVHEIGHYLGLFHTFEGGCDTPNGDCHSDGDHICDTPTVAAPNFACLTGTDSCPGLPVDDLGNYMDYGDDNCVYHFTNDQVGRMLFMLNSVRSNLISTDNQVYTGTCGFTNLVSANFDASVYTVCSNNGNVNFSTAYSPSFQYSWNFGDSATSILQNPSHNYNSALGSPYTVTLTVTNTATQATATKTEKIYVTNCSPIANENSYWYVGFSHGLQFNSGIPVFDTTFPSNHIAYNNSSVQSTSSGALLFYANRDKIYNSSHNVIANNISSLNVPPGNSILTVPKPGSSTDYYVFTNTWYVESPYVECGFRYNIVRVTGGIPSVISTRVPITQPSGFGFPTASDGALVGGHGVAAIKKCNNEYWIVTSLSNILMVYRLSSTGLTYVSYSLLPTDANYSSWNIEASPSGNKIFAYQALVNSHPNALFDFNKATGTASQTYIPIYSEYVYGAAFSPDSKLLYTTESARGVLQYNLNSANINSTKTLVGTPPQGQIFYQIQRGPDEKLYIGVNTSPEFAVIHNPNTLMDLEHNITCNFSSHGPRTAFNQSNLVNGVLPNVIETTQTSAYPSTSTSISAYITSCGTYKFFPDFCGTAFNWDFGDGTTSNDINPLHTFPGAGTYTVTLRNSKASGILASINVVVTGLAVPTISGSTFICRSGNGPRTTNHSVSLQPGQTAIWSITPSSAGSIFGPNNQSSVNVNWTTTGTVSVIVTDNAGCTANSSVTITEANITPTISNDNWCSTSDYSTTHTTTIPPGYTAEWSFKNGIIGGTFSTPTNLASVGVNWTSGICFGYLGLTLTNPNGCTFSTSRTIKDQCACDCLNTKTYNLIKSGLKVRFTTGNSNPNCASSACGALRYSWGDGTSGFGASHTYAAAGTYTIIITPVIIGAFDETICAGTPYTTTVTVNCDGCELGKQNLGNVTIFPNPASSVLNYVIDSPNGNSFETVLRTVDGKEIIRKQWNLTNGQRELQLELPAGISDGMLFVELISDEVRETRTILIKK